MLRKLIWASAAAALLLSAQPSLAEESTWDSFVNGIGKAVYFAAFPTAAYRGARLERIHRGSDATEIVFIVYGISTFDHDDLWTEAIVTVKNLQVVNLRFGDSNAVLSAPGSTMKNLGMILADLTKQYQARHGADAPPPAPPTPPSAPPTAYPPTSSLVVVHMTWVLPNRCSYASGLQARFFDATRNFVWPADRGKVFALPPLTTKEVTIDSYQDDIVCIGASYRDSEATYWGVGPSNDHTCPNCCFAANNGRVDWPMTCN